MPGRTKSKPGAHCKKKQYKRSHATKCRSRDIDQIQVRLVSVGGTKPSRSAESLSPLCWFLG